MVYAAVARSNRRYGTVSWTSELRSGWLSVSVCVARRPCCSALCVTTTQAQRLSTRSAARVASGSIAEVGSSTSKTLGCRARATASTGKRMAARARVWQRNLPLSARRVAALHSLHGHCPSPAPLLHAPASTASCRTGTLHLASGQLRPRPVPHRWREVQLFAIVELATPLPATAAVARSDSTQALGARDDGRRCSARTQEAENFRPRWVANSATVLTKSDGVPCSTAALCGTYVTSARHRGKPMSSAVLQRRRTTARRVRRLGRRGRFRVPRAATGTPRRSARAHARAHRPRRFTLPLCVSRWAMHRSIVVFPAPLGPRSTRTSGRWPEASSGSLSEKLTPSKSVRPSGICFLSDVTVRQLLPSMDGGRWWHENGGGRRQARRRRAADGGGGGGRRQARRQARRRRRWRQMTAQAVAQKAAEGSRRQQKAAEDGRGRQRTAEDGRGRRRRRAAEQ